MAAAGKVEEMVEETKEGGAKEAVVKVARAVVGRAEAKMEGRRKCMSRPGRREPGRKYSQTL